MVLNQQPCLLILFCHLLPHVEQFYHNWWLGSVHLCHRPSISLCIDFISAMGMLVMGLIAGLSAPTYM